MKVTGGPVLSCTMKLTLEPLGKLKEMMISRNRGCLHTGICLEEYNINSLHEVQSPEDADNNLLKGYHKTKNFKP